MLIRNFPQIDSRNIFLATDARISTDFSQSKNNQRNQWKSVHLWLFDFLYILIGEETGQAYKLE